MIILLRISDDIQPHVNEWTKDNDAWKKLQQVWVEEPKPNFASSRKTTYNKGGEKLESLLHQIS